MSDTNEQFPVGQIVGQLLPYLRRYARALTGSQKTGDNYAAATLEAIISDRSIFETGLSPKTALFKAFHAIWTSAGAPIEGTESGIAAKAQAHGGAADTQIAERHLSEPAGQYRIVHVDDVLLGLRIDPQHGLQDQEERRGRVGVG